MEIYYSSRSYYCRKWKTHFTYSNTYISIVSIEVFLSIVFRLPHKTKRPKYISHKTDVDLQIIERAVYCYVHNIL